jgi:hypothetical protein
MDILSALQVYRELADWYERQGQPAMRDRFLILAAEAAFSAGKPDEAERLRQRLLQGNPHHMLKPFNSFAQALQSTNIQIYIHDLQVNYPPQAAEGLLHKLRGEAGPTAGIPPTAPLIEVRDEPTLPLGGAKESLKVYSLREEPEATLPPEPPSKPASVNRPAPRKPTTVSPPAAPPPRPSQLNTPVPRAQPVAPPRAAPARPAPAPAPLPLNPEPGAPAGAWLTFLLFGMTVTAGVALAVYTLARPFLPPQWLP